MSLSASTGGTEEGNWRLGARPAVTGDIDHSVVTDRAWTATAIEFREGHPTSFGREAPGRP